MSFGHCERCGHRFGFRLCHNGFNETGYAYCSTCGRVAYRSTHDRELSEFRNGSGWPGVLPESIADSLPRCKCGGTFSRSAAPRCPACRHELSADASAEWIERAAPPQWRWQRNWTGCYSLEVEQGSFHQNDEASRPGGRLRPWVPFDPRPLVRLAQTQLPDRPELASALSACTRGVPESMAYIRFVKAEGAIPPGTEWVAESVQLQDGSGSYLVDVLKDGRIGGIEFLNMLQFTV